MQTVNDDDSMVDAYARALRMNAVGTLSPDVISLSYGACELADTRGNSPLRSALESLFRMAALVGTTVVASTGDQGSSVCQMADPPGLGLDPMGTISYPASSPFMTAVGGTRLILKADNTRADEVVWNDHPYGVPSAGTGRSNQLFSQPWYQSGITGSLARTVPDVSALAAIQPGCLVVYGGDLLRVGGTSGAAPFVGANLAMVSGRRAQGRRAGPRIREPLALPRAGPAPIGVLQHDPWRQPGRRAPAERTSQRAGLLRGCARLRHGLRTRFTECRAARRSGGSPSVVTARVIACSTVTRPLPRSLSGARGCLTCAQRARALNGLCPAQGPRTEGPGDCPPLERRVDDDDLVDVLHGLVGPREPIALDLHGVHDERHVPAVGRHPLDDEVAHSGAANREADSAVVEGAIRIGGRAHP